MGISHDDSPLRSREQAQALCAQPCPKCGRRDLDPDLVDDYGWTIVCRWCVWMPDELWVRSQIAVPETSEFGVGDRLADATGKILVVETVHNKTGWIYLADESGAGPWPYHGPVVRRYLDDGVWSRVVDQRIEGEGE